jgi:Spy/CpxP family protein refolding chaperone
MRFFKKIFLVLALISAICMTVTAQENQGDERLKGQKKIKALYVAYITQELNLTETEAQQFWPIHAGYETEIKAINEKDQPELEREEATLGVKKKFREKFIKIIGANRTDNFYKKEGEFRKKLIERLKEHRKERGGPPPPRGKRHGMEPPPPPED